MATLENEDANILDVQAVNWRRIVYPVVGCIVVVLVGLGIYYYLQGQRDQREMQAREAILQARTPETLRAVAAQYSGTTQATFALLDAAGLSFTQHDYAGATADYQKISDDAKTDPVLRDSARIGLASVDEANGKTDDAIQTYLLVAHRGRSTPYAPFAYTSAARLYEQKGDHANEKQMLSQAAALGGESAFVKEAQYRLKLLETPAPTSTFAPITTNTVSLAAPPEAKPAAPPAAKAATPAKSKKKH
jgi:predicted negative regulator of RcsB-dependent stress response